jgi:hypothetical protein
MLKPVRAPRPLKKGRRRDGVRFIVDIGRPQLAADMVADAVGRLVPRNLGWLRAVQIN